MQITYKGDNSNFSEETQFILFDNSDYLLKTMKEKFKHCWKDYNYQINIYFY